MATRSPFAVTRQAVRLALLLTLAVTTGASNTLADDGSDVDLQGILPDYIPNGLTEGDFNQLGDNWSDWATQTGRLVADFYTSDNDNVRGRRATLDQLRLKVDTMRKALGDPQYLSIHGTLADLYGRLSRRVSVDEALLNTLQQDIAATTHSRLQTSLSNLAGSTGSLRSDINGYIDGDKWVSYLRLDQIEAAADNYDASTQTVALLTEIQGKLGHRNQFAAPQQKFLGREQVCDFETSLNQSLAYLQDADGQSLSEQLRSSSAELLEAIEEYELEPTTESMEAVRNSFDDIRRIAPDGGAALTTAMRHNYLNYNLRAVMDESLLQDMLRDTRMESGYINDMVAGAHVTGCQWTNTTVNLDLKPSTTGIRADLILNGTVRSSAQGETHVATVFTNGRHSFTARKNIYFDGDHFQHWCAAVQVGGGSCPYAAQTCLSWAPLLGGASEKFAIKVANDKAPETNAYSINKIRREVSSQFDRETGKMLNEAELGLEEKVNGPLRQGGYYPDIKEFQSTETELLMRTRTMENGELGGSNPIPLPIHPTHGVLVQAHESLFNQIGDRLELESKRFTPEELQDYLKEKIESITGTPVDLADVTAGPTEADPDSPKVEEIIFHDADAARFQIRGGEVVLILSMGLKLEDRDEIAPQRISVPLQFSLEGDKIVMNRGNVGVSPIGRVAPRERAQQIAMSGVMRSKIQEAFEPREFDSVFNVNAGDKQVRLKVTDLRARGGWLSAIATDGISESAEPVVCPPMQQAAGEQTTVTQ